MTVVPEGRQINAAEQWTNGCGRNGLLAWIVVLCLVLNTTFTHSERLQNLDKRVQEPLDLVAQDCTALVTDVPKAHDETTVDFHLRINDTDLTCDQLMGHFHALNEAFRSQDSQANPPLINYAFYAGQGFGRLLDHSTAHCLLALALNRPCAVDLSDRDPYYTWRSFFAVGTFDWEMDGALTNVSLDVARAVKMLAEQGHGEWPADDHPQQPIPDLHLMRKPLAWPQGGPPESQFWEQLERWRPEQIDKPILSPNWGPWFPLLRHPDTFGQCKTSELISRIQNALYAPTPLAAKLHHERTLKVKLANSKPYGAIHIRYVILQQRNEVILPQLQACLSSVADLHNIFDWWIISDRHAHAIDLTASLTNYTFYYDTETAKHTNVQLHSNQPSARGKFGHADMSVSVLDWMVLYDSQVAIVTTGSYGATGARGHNKVLRSSDACGSLELFY